MSSNFKFVLNRAGVGQLLKSSEMQEVLMSYGSAIANKAGDGYKVKHMTTRVIAVTTATKKARQDNLDNNTLLKAMGGVK